MTLPTPQELAAQQARMDREAEEDAARQAAEEQDDLEPRIVAYEQQPYARGLDVEVQVIGQEGGRLYAVLDDTVLFPEGGGQPADHGQLNGPAAGGVAVVDVQKQDGEVRHFFEGDLQLGAARLELDWQRRYDHMQQHSAQHVLTAVAADRFGWATTSFHLRADVCDVELDVESLSSEDLARLEESVMEEVRAARPIKARRVSKDDLEELPLRTRGLPDGHQGDVRLVEIDGLDLNNCGGTHLASTAEIEALQLLGTESRRGGTRLLWVAGGRVRARLRRAEACQGELRRVLGTSDDELVDTCKLKLDQLRQAEKRIAALKNEMADLRLADLLSRSGPWIEHHFEDADLLFLQRMARAFVPLAAGRRLFLTASRGDSHAFVLARGEDDLLDVSSLGGRIAELLGGRGGGRGTLFQGKAQGKESMAQREDAVALLQAEDGHGSS